MADEETRSERGFTVIDRRHGASEPEPEPAEAPLPGIDFATFVISLGTSALYHLGLVDDPQTGGRAEKNLPLAQQTIDTLEMLERKTRGNLEKEEAQLLENLLYELRMRFVEASD